MDRIVAPIKPRDSGPQVANLQEALLALLGRHIIRPHDAPDHPTAEELEKLTEGLQQEHDQALFGKATPQLITYLQAQEGLDASLRGVVEDKTAARLNELLTSIGVLDGPEQPGCVVHGTVEGPDGEPLSGAVVRVFARDVRKEREVGHAETDELGQYLIHYVAEPQAGRDIPRVDRELPRAVVRSLIVRAFLGDQRIDQDVTLSRPKCDEVVNFKVPAPAVSEWESVSAGVMPLLQAQGEGGHALAPWELVDRDLTVLAEQTGLERDKIRLWGLAFVAGRSAAPVLQPGGVIPGNGGTPARLDPVSADSLKSFAIFYGWFRQGQPTDWDSLRVVGINTLRQAGLDAVEQNIIPAQLRDELEGILARIPNQRVKELADLHVLAALPEGKMRAVLAHVDAVEAVSDETLSQLVEQRTLAAPEAERLGLTVSLHRLAGGEPAVVSTMLKTEFPSVKTGKLQQARDLVALEPEDWQRVLEEVDAPIPQGMSRPAQARALTMEAAGAFPEAAFRLRAGRVPPALDTKVEKFQTVLSKNRDALARKFEELDLAGVPAGEREKLREAHGVLKDLVNVHPGLGLDEVFAKPDQGGRAAKVAEERIGWVSTVLERNPAVDFLDLNYLPDSAELSKVDFSGLPEGAKERVVANFKAHMRMKWVTDNPVPALELMKAGFHSASAIAATPPVEFAEIAGLPVLETAAYHAKAVERANVAAVDWFSIYDLARDQAATPVRAIPSRDQFFRLLTGFTQLLNDEPWCNCADCQSVLSPAAYFVDLLYYIEENILKGSFKGQENHPLHLEKRRPDLWELPLTCKNTTEFIPHLDVVNEILERYLKELVPLGNVAEVYKHLAEQDGSFNQPFTLPIERLEILLGHFGLTRYDIARAMQASRGVQVRARLNMSMMEYSLITTERTDLPSLRKLFKLVGGDPNATRDTILPPMEMLALIGATGLSHDALEAALKSTFVGTDGSTAAAIAVILGKKNPNDVQNNSEVVKNLTFRRLDRLHRFIRLWRKLPWTIEELDHVLGRLARPSLVGRIDPETAAGKGTLERILDLLDVNAAWSLAVEELIALSDAFPAKGLRESSSLFDRLFNQPSFVSRDGLWPPQTAGRFTHPAWTKKGAAGAAAIPVGVSIPPDNTLTRLLAGLQLKDAEFVELVAGLETLAAIDHQAATALVDENIALSRDSISALYRHARLLKLLGVSISDFIKILQLAASQPLLTPELTLAIRPTDYIDDLGDVKRVAEFAAWQKTSGFSLDEIAYLIGGPSPKGSPDPAELAGSIVATVTAEKSLEFADTIFTQIGLTEAQSRRIVLENASDRAAANKPFEAVTDSTNYRLQETFDPATASLVISDTSIDQAVVAPLVRNLLTKYHPMQVLDVALGRVLGLSPEETKDLRELAHPLAAVNVAAIGLALHGGSKLNLTTLLRDVLRFRVLFKSGVFLSKSQLSAINGLRFVLNTRAIFEVPNNPAGQALTIQAIRNVASYVAIATDTDVGFTTASGPADLDAIQAVVAGTGTVADLAKTLRSDEASISALKPHLQTLPANPFEALGVMARCLELAGQLGVSGETLELMVTESSTAETFDRLSRAAEDVFGAFRAKYPVEKTFKEKLEPYEDKLRNRKRDSLVDYVVTRWPEPFADPSRLYEYFLIDVLQDGGARTSRVVAAISSLQLYVHRVLMNLERSSDWGDPIHPGLGVYARFTVPMVKDGVVVDLGPAKRREWQWRQHYRVWEANRKVFLYPENYIEPELRDDKTPLFKELEDTLLLQEISPANVRDAYSRYLTGFDELARLKIAGAYYDKAEQKLHVFGVTQDDAPAYYYRTVDESGSTVANPIAPRFSAWEKLSLQIPVRKVSPIVFQGRLYVFWLETATRPVNAFAGGSSHFGGYRHTVRIKYTTLRLDGAWSAPQVISFVESSGTAESLIVEDPLDEARKQQLQHEYDLLDESLHPAEDAAAARYGEWSAAELPAAQAAENRRNKQRAWNNAPDDGEKATIAAAFFFGGPGLGALVSAGIMSFHAIELRDAIALDTRRSEELRVAKDRLDTANAEVARIKKLQAAILVLIANLKIYVRWDKSLRDHTEALDSYRPEGWEWERVYPDTYEDGIRLTLVPQNDPFLLPDGIPVPSSSFPPGTPVPAEVSGRRSGDFEPNPGVLRDSPNDGQSVELGTKPNWANGKVQLVGAPSALLRSTTYPGQQFYAATFWLNKQHLFGSPVANAPATADIQSVNGEPDSMIIESQGDSVWMRRVGQFSYAGTRFGTGLSVNLAQEFWRDGPNSLLDAHSQERLEEVRSKISPIPAQSDPLRLNPFHPDHPCVTYFREAFFHIPFLVANHLNSQQDFAETQRWYHYVFNPTAAEGDPWRYREFREQKKLPPSLRELLTSEKALEAYRKDPFSPHAIARTRLSAYQKSIVMKYIDNLLDWGDSLFSQFTMESINEATMLYVMAQDILGPRPRTLGSCGEGDAASRNYRTIRAGLKNVSDFLVELEAPPTVTALGKGRPGIITLVIPEKQTIAQASTMALVGSPGEESFGNGTAGYGTPVVGTPVVVRETQAGHGTYWTSDGGIGVAVMSEGGRSLGNGAVHPVGTGDPRIPPAVGGAIDFLDPTSGFTGGHLGARGGATISPFGELAGKYGIEELDVKYDLSDRDKGRVFQKDPNFTRFEYDPAPLVPPKETVFFVPPNKDLLAYWSRVEDRLFKIRNCMDIAGVRRSLELFSPELDPRMLVRMKAAGLSLEDVLNSTSGNLPPYRFAYLIDKAKQFASTLQSFGGQLLSALEKRDAEELSNLRAVHEQNLLKMRTKQAQLEIRAAEDAIEGLRRQKEATQYRREHFVGLRETGQIAQEYKQQDLQRQASDLRTQAGIAQVVASILTIVPDVGAPTAMKFGGSQLGAAGRAVAEGLNAVAAFNEMAASRAGVEASNKRRDEEWKHQAETARREIEQIDKNITAAEIRRDIAVRSLEVHEQTVTQTEELFDFFRDKFTSVDRYRLLSKELRRLYRLAFNSALAIARMTEQAYRAERTEDDTLLSGNYWDAENAGLLAGERLLVDLQLLERQFIEGNYRQLEIEQSLSLAQFAPDQLAQLRLTGECDPFEIPEWFFDLSYPGQYRRRLKAVRMTIPCVTGPYTNVGATLRLNSSQIRLTLPDDPTAALGALTAVPLRHTVSIATSKAQNDAGVFDFNFRDERYMPFEGAGAISWWQVTLPKTLRVFDYGTISDVILHLSYTADHDEGLKRRWDGAAQELIGLLTKGPAAAAQPPMKRLFSFRSEFPDAFHRIVTSPRNTEIGFTIEARHFPFFLNRDLVAEAATVRVISPLASVAGATFGIAVKATLPDASVYRGVTAVEPPLDEDHGHGLSAFKLRNQPATSTELRIAETVLGDYLIKLTAPGPLASSGNGGAAVDPIKLHDIILEVAYRLA